MVRLFLNIKIKTLKISQKKSISPHTLFTKTHYYIILPSPFYNLMDPPPLREVNKITPHLKKGAPGSVVSPEVSKHCAFKDNIK